MELTLLNPVSNALLRHEESSPPTRTNGTRSANYRELLSNSAFRLHFMFCVDGGGFGRCEILQQGARRRRLCRVSCDYSGVHGGLREFARHSAHRRNARLAHFTKVSQADIRLTSGHHFHRGIATGNEADLRLDLAADAEFLQNLIEDRSRCGAA